MKIEILGTGCPNCRRLEENARRAVRELGLAADIEKVTEIDRIVARGVMTTPALVVDGRLVTAGRVPTVAELRDLLPPRPAGPGPLQGPAGAGSPSTR